MTADRVAADLVAADLVAAWSKALHGVVYVPLTRAERTEVLTGFATRLRAALTAEVFEPAAGWRVGQDLVAAGFATPETLGCTLTVISTRLGAPGAGRLTELVEALAGGFTAAMHDRALDAQEAIRTAALTAQARAEQALRDSEARFRHLATHDPVTGLPNRTLFAQRLATMLAGPAGPADRLAVCCLDLDRFAAVTDSLGHEAGDRLLRAVADRLGALAATTGWLVAQLDTDQFAILVEGTSGSEDAIKAADRALSTFAEPFQIDDVELPVTARAGVMERRVTGADAVEPIRAAQIALHWAKADRARWRLFGRNRSAADAARYRLSSAMPKALRRGEFTLAYQPLVDLGSHRVVGVEALARWRHRERGLLTAGEFIGLAEQTGLIVPLGTQLLARACQQAAVWHQLGPDAPYVSVNLAAAQLHQPGLVGQVAQILDRSGLAPERLQLEVIEEAIVDHAQASATLAGLARLGVRIAVDDFGTGHSNLARLRDLPVHVLKLDATLTASDEEAFLAAVVSMGRALALTVTAEGIETAADAARMRRAGCDTGQGWHLGRPEPAHRITPLVAGPAGAA